MRSQPIFRPSVLANHVFTASEVNHAKQKIFQANVFNTERAFTPSFVYPAVFSRTFNQLTYQSSWALSKTQATESVGITEALPNSVRGIVRTATLEIVGIVEGSLFSRGKYRFIGENIASSESIGRARDVARSIAESVAISQFDGRIRDLARTLTENLGITEANDRVRVLLRTLAFNIAMTESQMQRLAKYHILSASMGITETNLRVRSLVRILTHNIAM